MGCFCRDVALREGCWEISEACCSGLMEEFVPSVMRTPNDLRPQRSTCAFDLDSKGHVELRLRLEHAALSLLHCTVRGMCISLGNFTQQHVKCLDHYSQIARATGVLTSSIGRGACVRVGAWVVPLQGAVAGGRARCPWQCALEPGCWCHCRVLRTNTCNIFCYLGSVLVSLYIYIYTYTCHWNWFPVPLVASSPKQRFLPYLPK